MAIRPYFAPALLLGSLLALALPALAQEDSKAPDTKAPESVEIPQVQVSTLFDVKAFVPGQMAHLVVILDVPKDWHIYWTNPGAGGAPTAVRVTGPEGWTIHSPRFPGPLMHREKSGEATYVMKDRIAFFVPIIPPDNAKIGTQVEFDLQVDWMIAKGVRKSGSLKSKVPAQVSSGLPVRNSDRIIAAMRSTLPRRGLGPSGIGISLSGNAQEGDLTFQSTDAKEFEFFAYPDSPMFVVDRNSETKSVSRSMRNFHLKPAPGKGPKEIEVHGVLRVSSGDKVYYYEVQYRGVMNLAPREIPAGHGNLPELPKKPHGKR